MKKVLFCLLLLSILLFGRIPVVSAAYVLPYPSAMPGNKIYHVMRLVDAVKNYWHWGSIAQTKYHLALSDKYLVEAKTLMEYNQYLLASDALGRSNAEFKKILDNVRQAKSDKKDISALSKTVIEAADKHKEVIGVLMALAPDQFTWTPEKVQPTELKLKDMLEAAESIRSTVQEEISSL